MQLATQNQPKIGFLRDLLRSMLDRLRSAKILLLSSAEGVIPLNSTNDCSIGWLLTLICDLKLDLLSIAFNLSIDFWRRRYSSDTYVFDSP